MLVVDVGALIGAGAGLVVIVGGIGAALVWIKRWMRGQFAAVATPAQNASDTGDQLLSRLDELGKADEANHELATKALAVAEATGRRLDWALFLMGQGHAAPAIPPPREAPET